MKVRDIVSVIEGFAPFDLQEPKDNTGLQVGSPDQEVHGVMIGFDCTAALVREAVGAGCDMILTHHPLLYHPLRSVDPDDPTGDAVILAIRHGVAVYSAHTSADKTEGGVSFAMAEKLGLTGVRALVPGGFGAIGDLPEPLPAGEALALVKKTFGIPVLRASKPVECEVRTIAMCGGSGSSLIDTARQEGAQLYICGDISYHYFFNREGFMVADVGHFESEVAIVDVFFTLLRKNFPNFAVRVSADIDKSNPIYYF